MENTHMDKTHIDKTMLNMEHARQTLKKYFGYDAFRLHQEVVIARTLSGQNSLVIMPTGGGKSICYQLPAVLFDGLSLVVSPLISLMQDQVLALRAVGITAEALNSGCSADEAQAIQQSVAQGRTRLLYVSPERAVQTSFIAWIRTQHVVQIAIDEAHCVSIWGNDFRPEYTRLTELTRCFPKVPVVALTATADSATQQDIRQQLALGKGPGECETFISSFERKNIHLNVLPAKDRLKLILRFLEQHRNEAGIVYCLSRKSTEEVAAKLSAVGISAAHYHAAMSSEQRARVQARFQRDDIQIVCATIAFGMGIDKPNIRWVIHYNLPKNIESYYQEIGRAGRDGQAAEALLFAGYGDMKTLNEFIQRSEGAAVFKEVQEAKLNRLWEFTQTTSCRTNLILNYFGEFREAGCGHCDRCLHPPVRFDGTVIAQKALSAVYRLKQEVGVRLLIDVLRGSSSRLIMERGYDQIPTYGVARDIDWKAWNHYLTQLIDLGYLGLDFTQNNRLVLTELSRPVLKGEQQVWLCEPQEVDFTDAPSVQVVDKTINPALLTALTALRKELADAEGKPAFTVFANATLEDMARRKPGTIDAFLDVSGVGVSKQEKYGKVFVALICSMVPEAERQMLAETSVAVRKAPKPKKSEWDMGSLGETHLKTLALYQQGVSIADIPTQRELSPGTIKTHLLRLKFHGEDIDTDALINAEQIALIQQQWQALGQPGEIKPVFDATGDDIGYEMIRYAICLHAREA